MSPAPMWRLRSTSVTLQGAYTHTQPFGGPEDLTQGLVSASGQSFSDLQASVYRFGNWAATPYQSCPQRQGTFVFGRRIRSSFLNRPDFIILLRLQLVCWMTAPEAVCNVLSQVTKLLTFLSLRFPLEVVRQSGFASQGRMPNFLILLFS